MINMKNKLLNGFIIILSIISLIELILNRMVVFNSISYSLKLWVSSIIPSIFPFFVISDILISYNITDYIPNFIKHIFSTLFKVNDNIITLFFLSILSGFPSSSRNARTMYDKCLITADEASHFLVFSHFANPLFILVTVGVFFLHDEKLGIIVLIAHYIPNIILGIIFRNTFTNGDISNVKDNSKKLEHFSKIFFDAVGNAIDTLLMILGTLTCFLVMASLIINRINLNTYSEAILKGILEMTIGLKSISTLGIPNIYKVVISSMILSFGGLSVHMQIISFLTDTDISYKTFFIARVYHVVLSLILAFLLCYIFI